MTRPHFHPQGDRDSSVRGGSCQRLGDEFVRRSAALREAGGGPPGPKETQIERLKAQNSDLKDRVTDRDATIGELTEFKKLAPSWLAAQHDEIMRLHGPQSSPEPATVPRARTTFYSTAADGQSTVSCDSPPSTVRTWPVSQAVARSVRAQDGGDLAWLAVAARGMRLGLCLLELLDGCLGQPG
ncbi:hypothetical protein ACGFY3_48945 [Streptomyces mirabilis]|uniref:hypothetical protein n=1 Tax=Streptomyces mirabilis TaxID=68239 RepID=UPI0037208B35